MKHAIIVDGSLNGKEYGMLRSFEEAIITHTNAVIVELPSIKNSILSERMGYSMSLGKYRKLLKKKHLDIDADVIWYLLMGPENYKLDLFDNWFKKAKYRLVYFFDTLQHQFPLIKRLFSNDTFNIKITSFNDAVIHLETITGHKWHHVEQAVDKYLFLPVTFEKRVIPFSSYGRRKNDFHEILKDFCLSNNLYYDYTTEKDAKPIVDAMEFYRQYSWHVTHSIFTVSWAVELTNKIRAGFLNPITCRWFEAAAAGTTIIGSGPNNPMFFSYFKPELICEVPLSDDPQKIKKYLADVWSKREELFEETNLIRKNFIEKWTWESRVNKILNEIVY